MRQSRALPQTVRMIRIYRNIIPKIRFVVYPLLNISTSQYFLSVDDNMIELFSFIRKKFEFEI